MAFAQKFDDKEQGCIGLELIATTKDGTVTVAK